MLLLFALIAGSSSVWAEEEVYSTCLFGGTHGTSSGYTTTWTATNGTFSWSVENGNTNGSNWAYAKFGRKDNASVGTVTTSAAYSEAITKVDITIDAVTANKINSIKLYTSSDKSEWTEAGSYTVETGTKSVALASPAANLYYKVAFDCAAGSSNGLVSVSKIEYYHISSGAVTPSCATPTFSSSAGAYLSAQNITISCDTEGATIYYTTNGDDPTTGSSVYSAPIAVSASTTIKALAAKDGYNNSSIATAEYSFPATTYNTIAELIAAAPTEPVILNLTDAQVLGVGAKDMYVKDASEGIDFYQLGLSYTAGQILNGKVAVTGYTVYSGSMPEITAIGENQIVATAGNLADPILLAKGSDATLNDHKWKFVTLKGTATGAKEVDGLAIYTNLLSFDNLIANVDNVTATGLIIPYKKNDNIIPELLPTNLTYHITLSKDMVTYYAGCKLDFNGTGLTVYSAKVENGVAKLTKIDNPIVTKEKGIILSGTAGQTYNVPIPTANATSISDNELVGVKAETAIAYSADSKYNYILQDGVFKKATGAKLKAGKAYLKTAYDVTTAGAPELKIVIGGETTGINMVQGSRFKVNGEIYNLNGQRVAQPTKGLYIVNGKKVVIK